MTQSNYNNENEEDERMDEYNYIPISCIDDSENNLYLERGMIIRYSKMLFGRPNNRFVVTDIAENCVDCMLKIRLLDKHGKLDVECWEIYNPYYIKVLSDDEVIMLSKIEIDMHINFLIVLFILSLLFIRINKEKVYHLNRNHELRNSKRSKEHPQD